MKKFVVVGILVINFIIIGIIFFKVETVYLLPTPIPENYKEVFLKSKIDLETLIDTNKGKPFFLHFYNPECPCSRFNLDHYKSLVKEYNDKITFIVVSQDNGENTVQSITEQIGFKEGIKIVIDKDKLIAEEMGVYSTPQAVILNEVGELYYRGNYNKSRYCTNPNKYYAQQAIDSLFADKNIPYFESSATTPYGCVLSKEKDFLDKLLIVNIK